MCWWRENLFTLRDINLFPQDRLRLTSLHKMRKNCWTSSNSTTISINSENGWYSTWKVFPSLFTHSSPCIKNSDLTWKLLVQSCIWKLYLKAVFEDCIWKLYLKAVFEDCIWKLYLKAVFEDCIWKLYLKAVFEDCIWKLYLKAVFEDAHRGEAVRVLVDRLCLEVRPLRWVDQTLPQTHRYIFHWVSPCCWHCLFVVFEQVLSQTQGCNFH